MKKKMPRREGRGEATEAASETTNTLLASSPGVNPLKETSQVQTTRVHLGPECWQVESVFTHARIAKQALVASPWLDNTFAVLGRPGRKKWIFEVGGAGMEQCLKNRKVLNSQGQKVGDWLSEGKQGVIQGLHPDGFFYRHNGKRLLCVRPEDIILPEGHSLSGTDAAPETTRSISGRLRGLVHQDDERPDLDYDTIAAAIEAIDAAYADEYDTWLAGGFALAWWAKKTGHIQEGRQLFHAFSQKSGKYDRGTVDEKWNQVLQSGKHLRPVTIGTLLHFAIKSGFSFKAARQDTEEDYDN